MTTTAAQQPAPKSKRRNAKPPAARKTAAPPAAPSGRIVLPASMEIGGIATVYAELKAALADRCPKYLLDGSALSAIDAAGIQLLLAFIRQLTGQGSSVEWESYSIPVYQLASELGIAEQLGD